MQSTGIRPVSRPWQPPDSPDFPNSSFSPFPWPLWLVPGCGGMIGRPGNLRRFYGLFRLFLHDCRQLDARTASDLVYIFAEYALRIPTTQVLADGRAHLGIAETIDKCLIQIILNASPQRLARCEHYAVEFVVTYYFTLAAYLPGAGPPIAAYAL